MSQLAALLKEYYEGSPYKTITDLAQAAQVYTPVSRSYVAHILRGVRQNPARDKLMAIARALELSPDDTNRLLEAAGFPGTVSQDPQIQRALDALQQLTQTPGASSEAIRKVVDGIVLMVDGFRASLGASALPKPAGIKPGRLDLPQALPVSLTPEEELIDDLLGEILARGEAHPLDVLFDSLEEAARGDRWEVKRRVAEALPRLVQLQPQATQRVAEHLRQDYHPDYRADIRRRVVEAVPALYRSLDQAALSLLAYREQDEVYTAMAAVEVLHDLEKAGSLTADAAEQHFRSLQLEQRPERDREVITFLRRLLAEVDGDPDTALASMGANRSHPDRLFRIVIQRVVPRLLSVRPDQALEVIFYFLRRDESGQPTEHPNLRRPVSRALPEILDLLAERWPDLQERGEELLRLLAQDPDIHVRRALSDALDQVVAVSGELGVVVLDRLIQDSDPYIRQRAWRALLRLTDLYPEQAAEYYARLLTRPGG